MIITGCGCISQNKFSGLDENGFQMRPNQFYKQNFTLQYDQHKYITGIKIADWSCVESDLKNDYLNYQDQQQQLPCKLTLRGNQGLALNNKICPSASDNFYQISFDEQQYYDQSAFQLLFSLSYIPMMLFEFLLMLFIIEIIAFSPCIAIEICQDKFFPIVQTICLFIQKLFCRQHEQQPLAVNNQQNGFLNNQL